MRSQEISVLPAHPVFIY